MKGGVEWQHWTIVRACRTKMLQYIIHFTLSANSTKQCRSISQDDIISMLKKSFLFIIRFQHIKTMIHNYLYSNTTVNHCHIIICNNIMSTYLVVNLQQVIPGDPVVYHSRHYKQYVKLLTLVKQPKISIHMFRYINCVLPYKRLSSANIWPLELKPFVML